MCIRLQLNLNLNIILYNQISYNQMWYNKLLDFILVIKVDNK